ncbi:MAG TPA: sigma-70 family RNA polymerase sigma factor [Planctomycetota bacterium]|nr:sigma-70 family RNA polymerase sigma factor [Planctomycetota bacterium]
MERPEYIPESDPTGRGTPAHGGDSTQPMKSPSAPAAPAAPSDHDYIRRAQQGDERAFEALVKRHQARALRVARNLIADPDESQDLAQEAFLRVFRSLDRFDFEHEFSTWIYRIVTNLAIDHLRRRRVARSTAASSDDDGSGLDLVDEAGLAPDRPMDAAETARRVRACIASLAPHFQTVLVLRELEGLACTDIARIVGATHVTVRWRLHRGRKLFQEEWERRERMAAAGFFDRANEPTPFAVEDGNEPGPADSRA